MCFPIPVRAPSASAQGVARNVQGVRSCCYIRRAPQRRGNDRSRRTIRSMSLQVISPNELKKDPAQEGALDDKGRLLVKPLSFWRAYSTAEIAYFAVRHGLYGLPTVELVSWLQQLLANKQTLEIGAGHGTLATALGIRATDNLMQTWPDIAAHYRSLHQATVPYGNHVEELDAHAALERYKPEVVLACWVTHKYDERAHGRGGNMFGVDEQWVLEHCQTYVHIGNAKTHAQKPLRTKPFRRYRPEGLVSRSFAPELDEVLVWGQRLAFEDSLQEAP